MSLSNWLIDYDRLEQIYRDTVRPDVQAAQETARSFQETARTLGASAIEALGNFGSTTTQALDTAIGEAVTLERTAANDLQNIVNQLPAKAEEIQTSVIQKIQNLIDVFSEKGLSVLGESFVSRYKYSLMISAIISSVAFYLAFRDSRVYYGLSAASTVTALAIPIFLLVQK